MLNSVLCICFLFISVHATGKFTILHSTDSVQFGGNDHLRESLLPDVYAAALGFTTQTDSNWQGLSLKDPFDLPKAIVTVAVDGVSSLDIDSGINFGLRTDESENDIFEDLKSRVEARYLDAVNYLIRLDLADGSDAIAQLQNLEEINCQPKDIKHKFLKDSVEEDKQFLEEVCTLIGIAKEVQKGTFKHGEDADVYWFKTSALHAVSDLHGSNSTVTKEAKHILYEAIQELSNVFDKEYGGKVLVNIITSDASHTRRFRRDINTRLEFKDLNLAEVYSDDYPVIFNIILWFGVAFVFSLLAITIFIANMDPGRDSIIYRMTSTRMKKDN